MMLRWKTVDALALLRAAESGELSVTSTSPAAVGSTASENDAMKAVVAVDGIEVADS